jgi:hypothetical protein
MSVYLHQAGADAKVSEMHLFLKPPFCPFERSQSIYVLFAAFSAWWETSLCFLIKVAHSRKRNQGFEVEQILF